MRFPYVRRSAAVLLSLVLAATTTAAAPPPKCLVKVNSGKTAAGNGKLLARKLAGASPGDTIHLGGICTGLFTITKDLTLVGGLSPGDTVLNGNEAGTVLSIGAGATVSIRGLLINNGSAGIGGGLVNEGDLTLGEGALVLGNGDQGGGVYNRGTLLMTSDAGIGVNFAFGSGAGIFNEGTATIEGNATVRGNTSAAAPLTSVLGGGIYNLGTLVLRGNASVSENRASVGGGIFNDGDLTLEDNASVTNNSATSEGGGIAVGSDSVVVVDPGWTGTTCDPANSPNDYDASNGGGACP